MNNKFKKDITITSIFWVALLFVCFFIWAFLPLIIYFIFGQTISAIFGVIWFLIMIIGFRNFVMRSVLPEKLWGYSTFLMWVFIISLLIGFITEIMIGRGAPLGQMFVSNAGPFLGALFLYGVVFGLVGSVFVAKLRVSNKIYFTGWLLALILPKLLPFSGSLAVIAGGVVALIIFLIFSSKK